MSPWGGVVSRFGLDCSLLGLRTVSNQSAVATALRDQGVENP